MYQLLRTTAPPLPSPPFKRQLAQQHTSTELHSIKSAILRKDFRCSPAATTIGASARVGVDPLTKLAGKWLWWGELETCCHTFGAIKRANKNLEDLKCVFLSWVFVSLHATCISSVRCVCVCDFCTCVCSVHVRESAYKCLRWFWKAL